MNDIEYQNPFKNIERIHCTAEEYRAIEAYSGSDIRTLYADRMNPYGVWKRRQEEYGESEAMLLGSVLDCMVTEPQTFDDRYIVEPEFDNYPTTDKQHAFVNDILAGYDAMQAHAMHYSNSSSKAAMALLRDMKPYIEYQLSLSNSMRKSVPSRIMARAKAMHNALSRHRVFPDIAYESEKQAVFVGEAFGVRWKGMIDFLYKTGGTFTKGIDLKTTEDWSGIRTNFFRRGYNFQGRVYSWLAGVDRFMNMYAESIDPHRTKLVDTTQYVEECGGTVIDLMVRLAHADKTGDWKHTMEYSEDGYENL